MKKYLMLSLIFFISAAFVISIGVVSGDITFGIAVFIPFIIGSGLYAVLGFLLLFVGMMVLFFSMSAPFVSGNDSYLDRSENNQLYKKLVKTRGIIFLGPFPIVFGLNKKVTVLLFLIAVIGLILLFFGWSYLF